jgi:hypothetical protein
VENVTLGSFPGSTGRSWSPVGPSIDNSAGSASFGGFSFGSQPGASGTGSLAILSLSAQGSAGDSTQLDLQDIQLLDSGGASETVTGRDGQVTIEEPNTAPTILGLPDQKLPMNGSRDNAIDLWAYAEDAEDTDDALSFTISNAPATEAGVSIDRDRYIDINPTTGWAGTAEVEIQVEDTGGLIDTDGFRVTVSGSTVYLPLMSRRHPPIPDVPVLNAISNPDGDGNYTVSWSSAYLANTYTLQEDDNAAFSSPSTAYSGSGTSTSVTGRAPGTYFYRVRASNTWGHSGWSNVKQVTVPPSKAKVYVHYRTLSAR